MLVLSLIIFSNSLPKKGYDIGEVVSDFKLKNVDGKMISLSDYPNAKGFIIIFDCNTCPVSKAYNARIIELNKKFAPQNFPVILINPNSAEIVEEESYAEMQKQAKEHSYDFPYLYDESQEVVKRFNPTNTPHVFVLNKKNAVLKVAYIGAIDNNSRDGARASNHYVEEAVNDLLNDREVATPKTKAIGCSVKIKNS